MRSLLSLAALAASLPSKNARALSASRIRPRPSPSRPSPECESLESLASLGSLELFASPSRPRTLQSSVEEALEKGLEEHARADENNLSPFLRGMVDEQREFRTNVGRAMDVLRSDYPYFLKRAPDYSIYHDAVTLSASDGQIQLSKLPSYKNAFGVLRNMLPLIYDADRSVIQSRIHYDAARTQVRVSFNAMLVPKIQVPGLGHVGGKTVHVDGISAYSLDATPTRDGGEGKIIEHRLEKLLVNGAAARPPYFHMFGMEGLARQQGGALAGAGAWS